jgi:hypothetical protein
MGHIFDVGPQGYSDMASSFSHVMHCRQHQLVGPFPSLVPLLEQMVQQLRPL